MKWELRAIPKGETNVFWGFFAFAFFLRWISRVKDNSGEDYNTR